MGEAAEWEIRRQYGVDISDDGYPENPPKRKRRMMNDRGGRIKGLKETAV